MCVCKKSALEKNVNSRVDVSPGDVVSPCLGCLRGFLVYRGVNGASSWLLTGFPSI